MNTEQFYEGPGASAMQTYVWEIAFILLGAFVLGYLLRLMLNSKYKSRILDLENEIETLKISKPEANVTAVSAPFDTTALDTKIRDQRSEIDRLNLKLSESISAKAYAENALNDLTTELRDLKANVTPMEISTPNLDVKSEGNNIDISLDTAPKVSEIVLESTVVEELPDLKIEKIADTEVLDVTKVSEIALESAVIEDLPDVELEEVVENEEVDASVNKTEDARVEPITVELASSEVVAAILKDDLKKIEGIGPKIESLLNQAGISSFSDLKEANSEYIREVLVAAGPNYAVHDPATWSEQATLANNGNWDALARLQEVLKGGKRK